MRSCVHAAFIVAIAAIGGARSTTAIAQPTSTNSISLQAKLDGVSGPTVNLLVKFFDTEEVGTGTQVGTTISLNAPVRNGIVSVPISPVGNTIFNGQTRYMEITVNNTTILPRTLVASTPYAIRAATILDSRGYGILSDGHGTGRLGINTTPDALLHVQQTVQDPTALLVEGRLQNDPALPVVHFTFADTDNSTAIQSGGIAFLQKTGDLNHYLIRAYYSDGTNPGRDRFRLDEMGNARFDGSVSCRVLTIQGADVAEPFKVGKSDTSPEPTPGMVVSIDPANPGKLMVCSTPYDRKVAGVISGANGLDAGVILGKGNANPLIDGEHPVAMTGRVWVYAEESGPDSTIQPGDRLTTSGIKPGYAMKVTDESKAPGSVIGKAMTPVDPKTGMCLVLVNLQ